MKTFHIAALFGAASLLAIGTACDGGKDGNTDCETGTDCTTDTDSGLVVDDTDTTDVGGPPTFDTTAWTSLADAIMVDAGAGEVTIQVRTTNWGYTPELYIADSRFTKDYDELHTMIETDRSDTSSGFSIFERTLSTGAAFASAEADVNSVFESADFDSTNGADFSVGVAVAVYDIDGNIADCIVFGYDPQVLLDGDLSGAAVSIPSWLNATDCHAYAP